MAKTSMKQRITNVSQITRILVVRRKALKLSQHALAEKLGITQAALSQVESGIIPLSVQRLLEITNVLDLEIVMQNKQRSPKIDW